MAARSSRRYAGKSPRVDPFGLTGRPKKIETTLKDCLRWAQLRSARRGHSPPEFTVRFLLKLWERQGGRCALTGARLVCLARSPLGVTLDRIDPRKSYTRRNTAIVARWANAAKGEFSAEHFQKLCRQAVRFQYAHRRDV
jgi:hypothetical protein